MRNFRSNLSIAGELSQIIPALADELGAPAANRPEPAGVCAATMGDGSCMFSNPFVCHQVAEAFGLPVMTVVLNNGEWGVVRQSVVGLYPGGRASMSNRVPLTSLSPSPDFVMVAKASRAWATRVPVPDRLESTLNDALRVMTTERRPTLVEVATLPG